MGSETAGLRERLQAALDGAYAVDRELGGGGMARVFLADDARLGRRVVVKVLAPELAAGISAERFEREIRVAARLQHPNVVPVLTAGERDGLAYYIMPYVEGESLRARLDRDGRLPLDDAVSILRDVARALAHAHARGVVHRDVKPDNVLLAGDAAAVADFGIAKAVHAARTDGAVRATTGPARPDTLTRAGTSLGTPAYMAPEQAAGDPDVDTRADVYAWGVMAYELLAGAHPFAGLAPHHLVRAQMTEAPPPLAARCAACPPGIVALVTHCLEKDPARRPPTAAALLGALDSARTPERPVATVGGRASRRVRAAVVAGVGLLGAGGWLAARRVGAPVPSAQAIAVAPFRVGGADPALAYLREGMVDLLATKLALGTLAHAVDARTLLAAWRRAAGPDADLAPAQAVGVARAVGAGQLLLGSVVGTPRALTLSAVLVASADRDTVATAEVRGPADSLPALVDQLAARLLTLRAGEGERHLAAATSTSLAALRAYLEGRSLLRRGSFRAAAERFGASLDVDSTFALAALGLVDATSWGVPGPALARGKATLARVGDRLPAPDRARAAVYAVAFTPPFRSGHLRAAAERLAALAPDSPEAAFHLGDWMYHAGLLAGIDDADRRAVALFERALALDSAYAAPLEHLPDLYLTLGDTTRARAAVAHLAAFDSAATGLAGQQFVMAIVDGDSARTRALRARIPQMDDVSLAQILAAMQPSAVVGPADGELVLKQGDTRFGAAVAGAVLRAPTHFDWGQPAAAARALARSPEPARAAPAIIYHAFGDGDAAAARAAAAATAAALDMMPPRAAARVLPLWYLGLHALALGDTAAARVRVNALRRLPLAGDTLGAADRDGAALQLETQLAVLERRRDLRTLAVRLDSTTRSGMSAPAIDLCSALVLARAWEALGDLPRARAAARRRTRFAQIELQLSGHGLREQARLAELAGDRADAMRAWRAYLRLRAAAEPALRADVDAARQALGRLERQARGR